MLAVGCKLHLGKCEGIDELTAPVSDEARENDAADWLEDRGKRYLVEILGGRWDGHCGHGGDDHDERSKKPVPDGAPRGGITVDLSEYVTKDVGDGKQYLRAADAEWANGEELGSDDIGNHQNHHE